MIENKDDAIKALEAARRDFIYQCRVVARRVAFSNPFRQATIDDVREEVKLPEGVDGRVFGAVFNTDEWQAVGFTKSKQKINHSRPITIFQLKSSAPREAVVLVDPFPKKEEVQEEKPVTINQQKLL